jgi:hypothetical protein
MTHGFCPGNVWADMGVLSPRPYNCRLGGTPHPPAEPAPHMLLSLEAGMPSAAAFIDTLVERSGRST